jgi:hypothetical protein
MAFVLGYEPTMPRRLARNTNISIGFVQRCDGGPLDAVRKLPRFVPAGQQPPQTLARAVGKAR